jgi:hypothetical protein
MDISQSTRSAEFALRIGGATDPRCKIIIFMGQTNPDRPDRHRRQSTVPVPMQPSRRISNVRSSW